MKNRKLKRFIAILMTVLMLMSVPVCGIAASALESGDYEYEIIDGEAWITSYTGSADSVTVPSKLGGRPVTGIGEYGFAYCTAKHITLPDGIKTIGEYAFYYCDLLEDINIPDSVTQIGAGAFGLCDSLKSINIPDSVTKIGELAFLECTSLTKIDIPDSVTEIGESAFGLCFSLKEINIPDGITVINNGTFYGCESLQSVEIPDSVTDIGDSAFKGCTGIKSLDVPDSVTFIGSEAFTDVKNVSYHGSCTNYGLYSAECLNGYVEGSFVFEDSSKETIVACFTDVSGTVVIPEGVEVIEDNAFTGCKNITAFELPSTLYYFMPDRYYAEYPLESISVAEDNLFLYTVDGVLFDKPYDDTETWLIFYPMAKKDAEYTVPDGVTLVQTEAFENCKYLETVNIPDGTDMGSRVFGLCPNLKSVDLPDGIERIMSESFTGCTSLTSVSIPDSVKVIGYSAFNYCSSLTSIDIPDSVTKIESCAFKNSGLTSVDIPDSVTEIEFNAFYETKLKTVTLPDSVEAIEEYAFGYCEDLTDITFGKNIKYIGSGVVENTPYYDNPSNWNNGLLYDRSGKYLLSAMNFTDSYCEIKDGTKLIACFAFSYNDCINEVVIPDTVTEIPGRCFTECKNLIKCDIPDSVTVIGTGAFSGCENLSEVIIGKNIEKIGDDYSYVGVFEECYSIEKYQIEEGNKLFSTDSYGALYNSDKTRLIAYPIGSSSSTYVLPASVTEIDNDVFEGCSNLREIRVDSANKYYASGNGALIIKSEYNYSVEFVPAVGTRYTAPQGVSYINTGYNSPFRYNENNPTYLDVPKSAETVYADVNYILYEGTEDDWKNGPGYLTWSDDIEEGRIFFNAYGKSLEELGIEAVDEHVITISDSDGEKPEGVYAQCLNTAFTEEVYIKVNENFTQSERTQIATYTKGHESQVYNISIVNSLGGPVTNFEGTVTVYIPAPEDAINAKVIHIMHDGSTEVFAPNPEKGEKKMSTATIDGTQYFAIDVESWSPFIIVWDKSQEPEEIDVEGCTFDKATGKLTVSVTGAMPDYASAEESPFAGNTAIKEVVIEDGVTSIGAHTFENCTGLEKITIPCSVTYIGDSAFNNCTGVKNLTMHVLIDEFDCGDNNDIIDEDAEWANIYFCIRLTDTIICCELYEENGVLTFTGTGDMPDYDAESTETLSPFFFNEDIKKVIIGDGITSIGDYTFAACENLSDAVIADSVKSIGDYAFAVTGLKTVTIGKNLTEISSSAFAGNSKLEAFKVSDENSAFCSVDGVLYSKDKKTLITYPAGKAGTSYTIPDGTEAVDYFAFAECDKLTSVIIPESVTEIGETPFIGCDNLTIRCYEGSCAQQYAIDNGLKYEIIEKPVVVIEKVSVSDVEVYYKNTAKLDTQIIAADGAKYTVEYKSSDPSVASVDKDGNVTTLHKGTATVTCTVTDEYGSTVSDTCTVTVKFQWWQWLIWILLFGFLWY